MMLLNINLPAPGCWSLCSIAWCMPCSLLRNQAQHPLPVTVKGQVIDIGLGALYAGKPKPRRPTISSSVSHIPTE